MTEAVNTEEKRRRLQVMQQQAMDKHRAEQQSGQQDDYEDLARRAAMARKAASERKATAEGGGIIEVELPDGSIAEFPAGTPMETVKSAMAKNFPPQKPQGQFDVTQANPSPSAFVQQAALASGDDRTISQILKENLLGDDDPTSQNTGEKIGSFLNKAGESLLFGLVGDEASAAVESLIPGVNYEDRLNHYRQQEQQFAEAHPIAALGAELAPLAIPGVGAMATAAKGAGMGARMLRGGAVAGGQGATYGFMEGEGGFAERVKSGAETGAFSAGLGFAGPLAGRGVEKYADHRATKNAVKDMVKNAPTADTLKSRASGFYDVGRAGVPSPRQTTHRPLQRTWRIRSNAKG